MKFFAVLSLALTMTQGVRLVNDTAEAPQLIQTHEKVALHEHAKLDTKVDSAALAKISARLDALEVAQWNLFGKIRNAAHNWA